MNFIQKIPKIFDTALDDKDLYIFFFEILLVRIGIEKNGPIFFATPLKIAKIQHVGYGTQLNTLYGYCNEITPASKRYIFHQRCTGQKCLNNECFFYLAICFRISYTQMFESFPKDVRVAFGRLAYKQGLNQSQHYQYVLERR